MKAAIVAGAMLLVLAPSSSTRADQSADQSQIKKVTDRLLAAQQKGDTGVLEGLLTDDFVGIHGDGTTETKAQYLASIRAGTLKYDEIDVRDSRVHIYGDAAVVYALLTFTGKLNGKQFTGVDLRNTRIWVRQQGDWKCVGYQVTRVASAKTGS